MDLKEIEKLMAAMQKAQIKRLAIKREGFEIELEKECPYEHKPQVYYGPAQPPQALPNPSPSPETAAPKLSATSNYVISPMVGTFYSSPSPDDPAFVKVGDTVNENSVMCIIEAMKVMNEVKAGTKGRVAEILLKNGDPVEFGTKIFRIEV